MTKYRIIYNDTYYRSQKRYLFFFWYDLFLDFNYENRKYTTMHYAELSIEKYKKQIEDEKFYSIKEIE